MPGQIKGITIEFDGNTMKLEAALRKVKSEAASVDSSLREVNRQLRFDPKNTELLGQKQTLLKQKIEASKESLEKFRNIQKQLDDQKVEKTSQAYMKVRREIIAAEGKLKAFNAQLAKAKWQRMKDLGAGIEGVGQKLTRATRYARLFVAALTGAALYKGLQRLKSLDEVSKQMEVLGYRGKKLDKIMEDVSGSVNGTRFMLQDMAKVASGALGSGVTEKYQLNEYLGRTADLAQLAGIDVQSMGAMLNKAYSKGKVDAKIMNQLNAHGIPIYKLMQKELGVTADELQDMSKKGKLSFDDLYRATNRYEGLAQKMGTETLPGALTVLQQQFGLIGADFLSGVYEPLKDGVKGIVASIKELRKNGTFKEWGQDLGDTVKYFVQYFKDGEASMDGLSERAQNLVTVLSPLIKTIGALVQMIAGLPPGLQSVLVLMTLFGGPALTALGKGVQMFATLGTNITTMTLNAQAGVGALGQLSGAASLLLNPFTLGTAAVLAWAAGMQKMYQDTHQSTIEFEEWKKAADESIQTVESSNAVVDIYNQKLQQLIDKEKKSAEDKALIKTYVDKLNGAVQGLNLKYNEEKDQLNMTSKAIEKKIEKYKEAALVKVYEDQITEAAKKEAEAQIQLEKEYEKQAEIKKKWADATDHSRTAQVGFDSQMAESNARIADAKAAIKKYGEEMNRSANKIKDLSKTTSSEMKKGTDAAKREGARAPKEYAERFADGKGKVKNAAKSVADTAKDALDVNTTGLGHDFASGFAKGIGDKVRDIANAAANMVKKAVAAARKEQQSGSPSRVMRKVGREYGGGDVLGILDMIPAAEAASRKLVASSIQAATIPARTGPQLSLQSEGTAAPAGRTIYMVNNFTINDANDGDLVAQKIINKLDEEARAY